jgi:chemotaxis protein MotB
MARKKKLAPTKRPVPTYMTSFADMMTLVLTFFVLLVAFAQEQRAGLVAAGTGSFVHAIDTLGLPGLLPGGRMPIALGHMPENFTIPERHVELAPPGHFLDERIIKPPLDRLRKSTIDEYRQHRSVRFSTTVTFLPGTVEIAPACYHMLDGVADLVEETLSYLSIQAYVSGPGDGWAFSARRAAAVARYLHERGNIAYDRMSIVGHGSFHPLLDEETGAEMPAERVGILLSSKPIQ